MLHLRRRKVTGVAILSDEQRSMLCILQRVRQHKRYVWLVQSLFVLVNGKCQELLQAIYEQMTIEQNILQVLTKTRDIIRANMASKGINASGRTSAALTVGQVDGCFALYLDRSSKVAPLQTLEIGREGGAVPKGFYYIIKQWTREKGIRFSTETERSRFAYFTARKIAREGTVRHKQPVNIYSEPVKQAREEIGRTVNYFVAAMIKQAADNFK